MRRTNEDKRRAVLALLNDAEWQQWSDREIARQCSVDPGTVAKLRETITIDFHSDTTPERTYTDRWGNTSVMDTSGLRRPAPEQPPEPELEQPPEQQQHSDAAERRPQAQFNRTNDNIEWAGWLEQQQQRQQQANAARSEAAVNRERSAAGTFTSAVSTDTALAAPSDNRTRHTIAQQAGVSSATAARAQALFNARPDLADRLPDCAD